MASANADALSKLTSPALSRVPPMVRLVGAHRCIHLEMNKPRDSEAYVLQFSNYGMRLYLLS